MSIKFVILSKEKEVRGHLQGGAGGLKHGLVEIELHVVELGKSRMLCLTKHFVFL